VAGSPREIRAFTSLLVQKRRLFFLKGGSNGDQTGPLGERGELSVGKVGRVMWKVNASKVLTPVCVD
jgi:hypothetical protein